MKHRLIVTKKGTINYVRSLRTNCVIKLGCDIFEDTPNKLPHKIPILEGYDAISGKGIPVLVGYMDSPSNVASESLLLQSLIKPINIKRLYVEKRHAEKAKEIVSELCRRR